MINHYPLDISKTYKGVQWIEIYSMESAIHSLNNRGQECGSKLLQTVVADTALFQLQPDRCWCFLIGF